MSELLPSTAAPARTRRPSTLVAAAPRDRKGPPGARLARVLIVCAAFTSTWTAVGVGGTGGASGDSGLKPVDLLMLLAALVGSIAVVSHLKPLPAWLWVPGVGVVLVVVVHLLFPTSDLYIGSRTPLDAIGTVLPSLPDSGVTTVLVAVRWLIALVIVPLLVVNLWGKYDVPVDLLVWSWAAGAAFSGLVAITDFLGITQVGASLIGYAQQGGRQTGLASQPNHLGFACALVAPVAVHLANRSRPLLRVAGLGLLLPLAGGIVLSGSRGAQLALFITAAVSMLLFRGLRRHLPLLAYGSAFLLVAVVTFSGHITDQIGHVLRFGGGTDASQSDSIRLLLAEQALRDAGERPAFGTGLQVLLEAHSIYLQALAAGGLVLLASLVLVLGGALRTAYRSARGGDPIAAYLFACVFTWATCGLIENQVTDRYLYIPIAAVAACAVRAATREPVARP